MAFLVAASLVVAAQVVTATIAAPGYALDPDTGVPIGTAIPEHIRVLSGPFNIAGAFTLVCGLNRFGVTWSFFLGELLGVVLIVAGFIVSAEVFSAQVRIGPLRIGRREVPTL